MKVTTLSRLLIGAVAAAIVVLVTVNYRALQQLKVEGPAYQLIVDAKDIVADILPPPLHLVETMLLVSELASDPLKLVSIKPKIAKLTAEFQQRKAFWSKKQIDPQVAMDIEKSIQSGEVMLKLIDGEFLPAVARRDEEAIKRGYNAIRASFDQHHHHVLTTVKASTRWMELVERTSRETEDFWSVVGTAITAVVVLLMAIAAYGLQVMVLRPVQRLRIAMSELARGERNLEVYGLDRDDEIGEMAKSVELFRIAAIEQHALENSQALQRSREVARQNHIETTVKRIRTEIGAIVSRLGEQAGVIGKGTDQLASVAGQTTERAGTAVKRSTGAASNAGAVAAATEQLGASIREIATQAHKATEIVHDTTAAAHETNESVTSLAQATDAIGSIVEIIRTVAEQTNLLALNATIEAARAGEAGKGFAVVATEVKSLAAQTAKATADIAEHIRNVQTRTAMTVTQIGAVTERIAEINALTGSIAAAVEEQEAATREIAVNVTESADHSRVAAEMVEGVLTAADQTLGETHGIARASGILGEVSRDLNNAFESFVRAINSDLEERRSSVRHSHGGRIAVKVGHTTHETIAQDVSLMGVRLTPVPGLHVGSTIGIDFGSIQANGSVRWLSDDTAGIAFERPLAKIPPVQQSEDRRAA